MRCPKCQYLGFDGQGRCRNCGYDFSLSSTLPPLDEPIETGPLPEPAADLPLRLEPTARERARAAIQKRQAGSRTPGIEAFDLPLFEGGAEARADDLRPPAPRIPDPLPESLRPMVTPSPTPRPPLSVRRPSFEPPRARGGVAPAPAPVTPPAVEPALDLDLSPVSELEESNPGTTAPPPLVARARELPADADSTIASTPGEAGHSASIGARVVAGLIDIAILGTVGIAVIAFTLQLTAVPWTQVGRLPMAPLAAFLALLAIGYLSMFTVLAGQTAGKMLTGIRVVESGGRPVRFGHAVLRAAVQVLTVPLLGLGFLPALLGAEHRALYDRLSDTEVVRAED